jgi:hypothetical protein
MPAPMSPDVIEIDPATPTALDCVAAQCETQFDIALRRFRADDRSVDPQAAVGRFGSAW